MLNALNESIDLKHKLLGDKKFLESAEKARHLIGKAFKDGNKLLIAGNGGSAADAQHFATEITATYMKEERRGYPALALTTDTSFLTAWGNDYHFHTVFARQVEALGKKGDVFFGISTSGNSENIIQAIQKAKAEGLYTVALLGNDGGKLKNVADVSIIVPSKSTARIQEVHLLVIHNICDGLVTHYLS